MWTLPTRERLENDTVILVPLNGELHSTGLYHAAAMANNNNQDLFRYMVSFGPFNNKPEMDNYLKELESKKEIYTWTVFQKSNNEIIGSVSLVNANELHGKIEIGRIWYNSRYHGTLINTKTLELLLTYIFEKLKYRRAAWQCDSNNIKSIKAAEGVGFKKEGIFRNDYMAKGNNRDTVWFSIIESEWEYAKNKINERIRKRSNAST
jgi:RimJ/RimL family protein N-acetyltransferase